MPYKLDLYEPILDMQVDSSYIYYLYSSKILIFPIATEPKQPVGKVAYIPYWLEGMSLTEDHEDYLFTCMSKTTSGIFIGTQNKGVLFIKEANLSTIGNLYSYLFSLLTVSLNTLLNNNVIALSATDSDILLVITPNKATFSMEFDNATKDSMSEVYHCEDTDITFLGCLALEEGYLIYSSSRLYKGDYTVSSWIVANYYKTIQFANYIIKPATYESDSIGDAWTTGMAVDINGVNPNLAIAKHSNSAVYEFCEFVNQELKTIPYTGTALHTTNLHIICDNVAVSYNDSAARLYKLEAGTFVEKTSLPSLIGKAIDYTETNFIFNDSYVYSFFYTYDGVSTLTHRQDLPYRATAAAWSRPLADGNQYVILADIHIHFLIVYRLDTATNSLVLVNDSIASENYKILWRDNKVYCYGTDPYGHCIIVYDFSVIDNSLTSIYSTTGAAGTNNYAVYQYSSDNYLFALYRAWLGYDAAYYEVFDMATLTSAVFSAGSSSIADNQGGAIKDKITKEYCVLGSNVGFEARYFRMSDWSFPILQFAVLGDYICILTERGIAAFNRLDFFIDSKTSIGKSLGYIAGDNILNIASDDLQLTYVKNDKEIIVLSYEEFLNALF